MRAVIKLPVRSIHRPICPMKRAWRNMTVSFPNGYEKEEVRNSGRAVHEGAEPLVALSKPPPLPPVLGPLAALSLLEIINSDGDGETGISS